MRTVWPRTEKGSLQVNDLWVKRALAPGLCASLRRRLGHIELVAGDCKEREQPVVLVVNASCH